MKNYTHICIVLDASGSMESIEDDTKGSFNSFLKKQREADGKTVFDLYQFADEVKRIVKSADLAVFKDDLMRKYHCSGCTALNDAICIAIDTLGTEFAAMAEPDRPEHVLFVIITDGEENASKEFNSEDVKKRIQHQQDIYQWEFDYLAANQDAFASGAAIGLSDQCCMSFAATPDGIDAVADRMTERAANVRKRKK